MVGGWRAGYLKGWAVSQRAAGTNMSVDVATGDGIIFRTTDDRAYPAWSDAVENVTISAASPSNPRRDMIVAWIDKSLFQNTTANQPSALKFIAVAGTSAASPVDPLDATIQLVVGAANPYVKLARVAVAANATVITDANITDLRTPSVQTLPRLYGGATNTLGHLVPNVADDTVALLGATQTLSAKTLDNTNVLGNGLILLNYAETATNQGSITAEADLTNLSTVVTVPSGSRRVKISFGVSLASTVAGDRVRVRIKEGITTFQEPVFRIGSANAIESYFGFTVLTSAQATAGSHTYKLSAARESGTGTISTQSADDRSFILVEAM